MAGTRGRIDQAQPVTSVDGWTPEDLERSLAEDDLQEQIEIARRMKPSRTGGQGVRYTRRAWAELSKIIAAVEEARKGETTAGLKALLASVRREMVNAIRASTPSDTPSAEQRAIIALLENPKAPDSEIALAAGVNRTSLYSMQLFVKARAMQELGRKELSRGTHTEEEVG